MLTTLLFALKTRIVLIIESSANGILRILYYKSDKYARAVLWYAAKHLSSVG